MRCTECGELKKLVGHGRCSRCYQNWRYRTDPEHRKVRQARGRARYKAKREELNHKNLLWRLRGRGGLDGETADYVGVLVNDPCVYCGERANHIDHVDPTGDSHWTNLASACLSCNNSKHTVPLLRFLLVQPLRRARDRLAKEIQMIEGEHNRRGNAVCG